MLSLDEIIKHVEQVAYSNDDKALVCMGIKEYRELAELLRELQERRKAPEIIYCQECKHFQCNMRFDGYVPKGADAYECRRGCGGCDPMDYCCYGERKERRTE